MSRVKAAEVLVDGLVWPESPRWHAGTLWFSDMFGIPIPRVYTMDTRGTLAVVAEFPHDDPAGLGFLPDGTLLVVSMHERRILAFSAGGGQRIHADLGSIPSSLYLSDMVVDASGRAYVDCLGIMGPDRGRQDSIVVVEVDGRFRIASKEFQGPNGLAMTVDRRRIVAAETVGHRLMVATVRQDGSLADRSQFADLGAARPDGICMDAEGAVWAATLDTGEFIRCLPGGDVAQRVSVGARWAIACVLGGADRRTLYMTTATVPRDLMRPDGGLRFRMLSREEREALQRAGNASKGFVQTIRVDVPGEGFP